MTTVLQYLVIAAVVAAILFGIALLVFGRGEQLSPLPARTSPVDLPDRNISGEDVRGVRFALAARGYRMSDVDWALERLADELDRTRERLADLTRDEDGDDANRYLPDPDQVDLFAEVDFSEPEPDQPEHDQPEHLATEHFKTEQLASDHDAPAAAAPAGSDER